MPFDEEFEKEVEEIIAKLQCSKDFQCKKSGFKDLCEARVGGAEPLLLVCCEKPPQSCKFLNVLDGFVCECPVRVYIAKKLKK